MNSSRKQSSHHKRKCHFTLLLLLAVFLGGYVPEAAAEDTLIAHWDFTAGKINSQDDKLVGTLRGTTKIIKGEDGKSCLSIGKEKSGQGIIMNKPYPELTPAGDFRLEAVFRMNQTPGSKAWCVLWDSKYIFYIRKTPQPADNHGFSLFLSPVGDEKYKPIAWIGCGDKGSEMFMGNTVSIPNGKICTISFTYKVADGAEILIDGKVNVKRPSKLKQPLSPAVYKTAIGDRYSGSFFPFQGDILDIKLYGLPAAQGSK